RRSVSEYFQPSAYGVASLKWESTAKPHNPAFTWWYEGCAVGYVHRTIWTNGHSSSKGECATGEERVGPGTGKGDLDHVALRIFAVNEIRVSEQLRGIEVAVTSEGATVDWPQPGSPLGHRCVPWLLKVSVLAASPPLGKNARIVIDPSGITSSSVFAPASTT